MAAGDLTLPVTAPRRLPGHGTVLADPDTAVLEAGPEPTIGPGDLLAVLTAQPVPALPPLGARIETPPLGGRVETLKAGRYF